MLNVNVSIANLKNGFPDTVFMQRIRHNKVGSFEDALNHCIDVWDSVAKKKCTEHLAYVHNDAIQCAMAALKNVSDIQVVPVIGEISYLIIVTAQDRI